MKDYTAVVRVSKANIFAISEDEDFMEDVCDTYNDEEKNGADDYVTVTFEAPDHVEDMIGDDTEVETEYGTFTYNDIAEAIKRSDDNDGSEDEVDMDTLGEDTDNQSENW